jgi:hypothetical protein
MDPRSFGSLDPDSDLDRIEIKSGIRVRIRMKPIHNTDFFFYTLDITPMLA